ncbi:hypothetical protein TRFO_04331 [Tritrichomonas foetus]|uniref:CCZ1/INTU/HSP4 first Longin domain-containing protein n=1 Tax=Tritrichomonas foetus TaxID=1144522 RepID=A0A1J4KKS0_9EUKA|nr:hypothetical protein TRFO_04331 [Tritrichomonas foetus]|eukprot:OHT10294.1 hypothetical protein TRFO_04331 [Tritrichomonas foetus]
MIFEDGDSSSSFFVFHHFPFRIGSEYDDVESNFLSNILFKYPKCFQPRELESFLDAIVSIFTYTTLSIGDDEVQLLSLDLYKIAIHTYFLDDKSCILLILRLTSDFPDNIVSQTLENIHQGLFFALRNSFLSDYSILKEYLENEGYRIFNELLNPSNLSLFKFSFPTIRQANWDLGAIIVSILHTSIQKLGPQIWGFSCFIGDKLLISQVPLSLCQLFLFAPSKNLTNDSKTIVFLTNKQREEIQNYPKCNTNIPDEETIPAFFLKIDDGYMFNQKGQSPTKNENHSHISNEVSKNVDENELKHQSSSDGSMEHDNVANIDLENNKSNTIDKSQFEQENIDAKNESRIETPSENKSIGDSNSSLNNSYNNIINDSENSMIKFFILADPNISEELIVKLEDILKSSFSFIRHNFYEKKANSSPNNSVTYDSILYSLYAGKTSETFDENILIAHDYFLNEPRLKEVIMRNSKDFTICYKTYSLEQYAFAEDNGKDGFFDLYRKAININPSLKKYIDTIAPSESAPDDASFST